jgi:hypothetical protein
MTPMLGILASPSQGEGGGEGFEGLHPAFVRQRLRGKKIPQKGSRAGITGISTTFENVDREYFAASHQEHR